MRRSQSFDFPERREPLGDPSHAGDPDDSTVFCGESIWTGESGLARQQVGFNVSHFISRSVWVILLEKVVSSGERGLGHSCGRELPQAPAPAQLWLCHEPPQWCAARRLRSPSAGCPWSWLGSTFEFCHRSIGRFISSFAEGSSLLCSCTQEGSGGTWASQSGE